MKKMVACFALGTTLLLSNFVPLKANDLNANHPSQATVDFFDYLREEKTKKNESDTHQNKTKKIVLTSDEKAKNKIKQKERLFKFLKDKKINHTARPQ